MKAAKLVLDMVRRAWFIALIGVVLTSAAMAQVWRTQGVYFGTADVGLVAPPTPQTPNSLGVISGSLISTTGIIQREVMGGPDIAHVVSDGVTLVDEGVRHGVSVSLPNTGGQWADNFEEPVLHVQSVDVDPDVAMAQLRAMVDRIHQVLKSKQDAVGVGDRYRITTTVTPTSLVVSYYAGDRKRAAAMTTLLGGLVTISVIGYLDRRRFRSTRKVTDSTASGPPPDPLRIEPEAPAVLTPV